MDDSTSESKGQDEMEAMLRFIEWGDTPTGLKAVAWATQWSTAANFRAYCEVNEMRSDSSGGYMMCRVTVDTDSWTRITDNKGMNEVATRVLANVLEDSARVGALLRQAEETLREGIRG